MNMMKSILIKSHLRIRPVQSTACQFCQSLSLIIFNLLRMCNRGLWQKCVAPPMNKFSCKLHGYIVLSHASELGSLTNHLGAGQRQVINY